MLLSQGGDVEVFTGFDWDFLCTGRLFVVAQGSVAVHRWRQLFEQCSSAPADQARDQLVPTQTTLHFGRRREPLPSTLCGLRRQQGRMHRHGRRHGFLRLPTLLHLEANHARPCLLVLCGRSVCQSMLVIDSLAR